MKKEGPVTEKVDQEYHAHIDRKERAREEKCRDSERAKQDNTYYVATFDLESVLYTPCSLVSTLYYLRKLSVYNLTIYAHGDAKGSCYMWDESQGKRGSCEIATCLLYQLRSLPSSVTEATFFSDTCTGQNRNQFVAAALLHAVLNIPSIKIINQKFLETGHTEMEVDSMHAAIEFAKRNLPIHTPSDWHTVLRSARRKHPYVVIPLENESFIDFKKLAKESTTFAKKDSDGANMEWMKLKWIQFMKQEPDKIFFKYNFTDEPFKQLRVKPMLTRRGRQTSNTFAVQQNQLPQKYSGDLSISEAKKKDLLALCRQLIIPRVHHPFYNAWKTGENYKDTLPEPDLNEPSQDSDCE